ncbi:hypothetical protein CB0940_07334 [Cercospora beticola]|uniref:Uncharacterized protein n=1 Tax=Cercospora beticola TaxID=122368 RepID=A0A2G5HBJ6_CERBT|nr:hypothetical protein CB0940_07334 [Cercospora beticola]PIA89653.1 hypothetical protein CB0940_07334 [Cercospora beticola]WPB03273.1 hypothetical protein RHO25_007910 [Cercospora beticola]CAK1358008.1 unnamed protein product [Cercospora beticola]
MASPDKQDSSIQAGLDESAELDHRIQALPQELQDEILDLTVAIKPTTVVIDKSYKPPWQLAIDQALRRKVAQDYYSSTIFVVEDGRAKPPLLRSWLTSLPADHTHLVSEIRLHWKNDPTDWSYAASNEVSFAKLRIWWSWCARKMKNTFGIADSVVRTKMRVDDGEGGARVLWVSILEAHGTRRWYTRLSRDPVEHSIGFD